MNTSFYSATRAAITQQDKMNVISNNISNVNTTAFKSKTAVFQDLYYYNMRATEEESTHLQSGTGVKVSHTNTDFSQGAAMQTGDKNNYMIDGVGFFMLRDPATEEISYTRNGAFYLSSLGEDFVLMSNSGKMVLDEEGEPIIVIKEGEDDNEDDTLLPGDLTALPAAYNFENTDGMLNIGNSEFVPVEKNGEPELIVGARVLQGYLENSNVDLAKELADTIIASRAYSYVLQMIQTTDEVQQTINNLR